jgi:hypothetical protein
MVEDFTHLKSTLVDEEKKILDDIYEKKTFEIKERLQEEIKRDTEHLALVNLCYNLFTKTTEINKITGYKVVLADPLCTLGAKNFDLMLYNEGNQNAILIEAKSSVSERGMGNVIDETILAATELTSNKERLETILGSKMSKIEFAILSFAYYVDSLKQIVSSKNAPICLWAYHVVPGLIQLVKTGEDIASERAAGRMHEDENMRQVLLKGIPTRMGSLRSLPIMPTSHMFTKLEYIAQQLFILLDRKPQNERWFGYSEVYNLCKQAFSATELDDSQVEEETKKIITSAMDDGLFRKISEDEEIPQMEFEISYNRRNYERFLKDYLERRAKEKAFSAAIEEFRQKKGLKKLNEF